MTPWILIAIIIVGVIGVAVVMRDPMMLDDDWHGKGNKK